MVSGTREHAEHIVSEIAAVLAPMGLRLSAEKTAITHIDEGLDFLGWRIQRHRKRGTNQYYVYTYPSRKTLKAVKRRSRRSADSNVNQPLQTLLRRLNPALRGWSAYFRPGVSSVAFSDLANYTWTGSCDGRGANTAGSHWKIIRRRYCSGGWWPATPRSGYSTRTRCAPRATATGEPPSPLHGQPRDEPSSQCLTGLVESPMPGRPARRVREAARGNPPVEIPAGRPESTSQDDVLGPIAAKGSVANRRERRHLARPRL